MKRLIHLLATLSAVCGIQYDGLRVKFGWSDALADIEYFYKIPRTIMEAEAMGWRRQNRPSDPLPELRMHCMANRNVCVLYDVGGFVAGLQISYILESYANRESGYVLSGHILNVLEGQVVASKLPIDEFVDFAIKADSKMNRWKAMASFGEPTKEYWTLPIFFVSEESLKAGSGPSIENGATLQDGGVWVFGNDARLMRIPSTEAELNSTAFKKQNCIPNMGTHYYYNMTPQMRCSDFLPWFALVSDGELVGAGFQFFGKLGKQKYRDWYETLPPSRSSAEITIPNGPQCLYDWTSKYPLISLHIYFVDKPWNIRCKDGDSIKQASVMNRVKLTSYRYASQFTDQIKKIFVG